MAEELAQEIFFRVYRAAPRYRPDAKFSTWLFRIATNVCLNEVRKTRYKFKEESLDTPYKSEKTEMETEFDDRQAHDILEDKEREMLVRQAITELPEKQRAALLLRVYDGFSYKEIGKKIRRSESSVKTIIHRGRQSLKMSLQKYLKDENWS